MNTNSAPPDLQLYDIADDQLDSMLEKASRDDWSLHIVASDIRSLVVTVKRLRANINTSRCTSNTNIENLLEHRTWLEEAIADAKEDVKENAQSPNSYGSGYDKGYLFALESVHEYFLGENDI
jgi:hypothetical protein